MGKVRITLKGYGLIKKAFYYQIMVEMAHEKIACIFTVLPNSCRGEIILLLDRWRMYR